MLNKLSTVIAAPLLLMSVTVLASTNPVAVLDTLGSQNLYNAVEGVAIGNLGTPGFNSSQTNRFSAPVSGTLYEVTAAMSRWSGSDQVTFNLFADVGGTVGTVLASATASLPFGYALVSTTFLDSVVLAAGTSYWLGISTNDATATIVWQNNVLGTLGSRGVLGTVFMPPGEWAYLQDQTLGATRLTVQSPVPEPSTAGLYLLGAVILGAYRAARRVA